MSGTLNRWLGLAWVLCLGLGLAVGADKQEVRITAIDSCRTLMSSPDNNVGVERLVVRVGGGDPTRTFKSWVKFDISELDVTTIESAFLTITFQRERGGCSYDISYVNDDVVDNIDWTEDNLTWNNAPGNDPQNERTLDPAKTTYLGRVETQTGLLGEGLSIDVLEALRSDTDGIVQFVLHNSSAYLNLASHKDPQESWRPYLTVVVGVRGRALWPNPADAATDVSRDVQLSWTPGYATQKHTLSFGTTFEDVNDGLAVIASNLDANQYDPGRLEFGQTYYWRVDEVNTTPDATVFPGDVWQFTVEPVARPIASSAIHATASSSLPDQGPDKTIDRSGLDANDLHSTDLTAMWLSGPSDPNTAWIQYEFDRPYKLHQMKVWNYNGSGLNTFSGCKDVRVSTSLDGATWTPVSGVSEFAKASGAPAQAATTTVEFNDEPVRWVRVDVVSNWAGGFVNQYGLSEVQFLAIPVAAREPSPESGAVDVPVDTVLQWTPGREAAQHRVLLSADTAAVIDGTVTPVTVTEPSYQPAALDVNTTYSWRVDEVNDVMDPAVWAGSVWSFTTADSIVVDDFESYNDEEGQDTRIYENWIDGFNDAGNGSQVGYLVAPFAEKSIVHSGRQSMPLSYTGAVSHADLALAHADWTRNGVTRLVIHFYGKPGNTGQLSVKINQTKIAYPGDAADLAAETWTAWEIDLTALASVVDDVTSLSLVVENASGDGMLFVDDILLK